MSAWNLLQAARQKSHRWLHILAMPIFHSKKGGSKMKKYIRFLAISLLIVLFPFVSASAKDKVRIGGDVIVEEGTEVKDAVAVGGNVTVYGKVRDSAVAVGGSVIIGPEAVIGKDVVSIGGAVQQAQGAVIHGDVVELNIPGVSAIVPFFIDDTAASWFWTFKIASLLGFLALAVLLVALLPKPFDLITDNVQQNVGKVILWALLGLVVLVPLTFFSDNFGHWHTTDRAGSLIGRNRVSGGLHRHRSAHRR
jgi:acetyltransferase-like isoleucine patch superfamily enzyme